MIISKKQKTGLPERDKNEGQAPKQTEKRRGEGKIWERRGVPKIRDQRNSVKKRTGLWCFLRWTKDKKKSGAVSDSFFFFEKEFDRWRNTHQRVDNTRVA